MPAAAHRPRRATAGADSLAQYIERLRAEVLAAVDDLIERPHPSPESLHDLHRAMRRLRHALALWERLLPATRRASLRPLDRRLTRLARLVGQVRDRDVMLELIEGTTLPKPPPDETDRLARLRARLRDDGRTGRELLKVFLRSERDEGLFEELRRVLEYPSRAGGVAGLRQILAEEEQDRREGAQAARRKARRRPTSDRLHRLRIRLRRLRHLGELERQVDPGRATPASPAFRRLLSDLGRLHDLDVVLGGLDPDTVSTAWGDRLRRSRRRLRRKLRRSIATPGWMGRPKDRAARAPSGRARPPGA